MRGPRDAAASFLRKLWQGQLLSAPSTRLLLDTMPRTPPSRIEPGLPKGVQFAHKGTSATFEGITAAFNDIGVIRWPDGRALVVAGFLTGSTQSAKERHALFAGPGRGVVGGVVGRE